MAFKSSTPFNFIIFLLIVSCAAHKQTNKVNNEVVSTDINKPKGDELILADALRPPQQIQVSRGLGEAVAVKGVSLAVDGLKKLITKDKKKYTAEYNAGKIENHFYNKLSTKGPMDFQGIVFDGAWLVRTFKDDTSKKLDTAVFISLNVDKTNGFPLDIVNNSVFRLQLTDFQMPYTKCKIPDHRWYLPWTLFYKVKGTVDVQLDVSIKATWMTKEGVFYDKVEIGKFSYFFENLPIDGAKQKEEIEKKHKGKRLGGYSMLVPRSYGYFPTPSRDPNNIDDVNIEQCWGQGLYNITFSIKETSDKSKIIDIVQGISPDVIDMSNKEFVKFK